MANLMDYLDWRGDLTLEISPFNEVDALILAELSFVDFDGIVPPPELGRGLPLNEAAEAFFARHGGKDVPMGVLVPDTISKMLRKLMTSPRFRNMTLNGYTALLDDSIEQQFAALTIDLGNGSIYISFRGTDDTIVGWKEDLNMGFLEEIPSQKQAVEYVARVARQYSDKTIRIGGHSKGGNLAVYSAAKSSGEIQERIVAVHNNDGPGFAWDISETPGHKRIASRIHTILPQTSVVGMLMEHEKRYQVVHSTYDGLYQHDGFSWQVLGTQFVHLDDFSREGKLVDETLSSWADSLNTQQREALADAMLAVPWDAVVLDESHKIKAPGGRMSRFCGELRKVAKQVFGLTGTPMPHSPLDIYAQYRAIDDRVFGRNFSRFRQSYAIMGGFGGKQVVGYKDADALRAKFLSIAFQAGRDVIELPEAVHQVVPIEIGPKARRVYTGLATAFYLEQGDQIQRSAQGRLGDRRQRCAELCHQHRRCLHGGRCGTPYDRRPAHQRVYPGQHLFG